MADSPIKARDGHESIPSTPNMAIAAGEINDKQRRFDAAALRREERDGATVATTPEELVALYWRLGHGEEGEGAPSVAWIANASCLTEAEVRRHLAALEGEVLE